MYEFQNPHTLWNSIDRQLPGFISNQKANEACMISIFAIGYQLLTEANTCEVRLVKDKEPIEAEVKTEKALLGFQIAMSLRNDRKFKEEYLSNRKIEAYPPVSLEQFTESIKKAVEKKVKRYGSGKGVNLLIYALVGDGYISSNGITKYFSKFKTDFDSVWVMLPISTFDRQGEFNGHLIIKITPNPTYYDHLAFANDGIGAHMPPSRYGAIP